MALGPAQPRKRLDGVGEGVPQVEQGPAAHVVRSLLALVLLDDAGLDGDVAGDELDERALFQRLDSGDRLEGPVEQGGAAHRARGARPGRRGGDQRVLDALGKACAQLSRRERAQRPDVAQDEGGLPEGADHVLAQLPRDAQVHRGLAAHGGVDHGQQRGGALHDGDAPSVHRRSEARDVAHDAPPQRDDHVASLKATRRHRFEQAPERVEALVRFTCVKADAGGGQPGALERLGCALRDRLGKRPVAHEQRPRGRQGLANRAAKACEQVGTDAHGVRPARCADSDDALRC